MQEQNLEEGKEKIDRSAEQITVPGYSEHPGLCSRCWRSGKSPDIQQGRKEHNDITGDLPELLRQLRCW